MRRDPIEVEQTARLELADAARKVKRELESTVLEFSYFRRATQQSLAEAVEEINTQLKDANGRLVDQLDEFAARSSKPLEEASKKSGDTILHLDARMAEALTRITNQVGQLSLSTERIIRSFESIVSKLNSLQTPQQIIEIKLNPMIQGLTRIVNNFGKHAELQAKAVDENIKQTQELMTTLLAFIQTARAERLANPLGLGEHDVRGPNA